ncbi:unnamed protein product [Pleuronectes platessa]|uniref:Uncharacterized protein n=1 Tax=Pleuronectes platessa TaxID=8262 RepID=A0A9N7U1T7_PLEPL|nr:unnamed protein product [Pleuronectes platessa]
MNKTDKGSPESSRSVDSSTEETPSKKTDIIEEFWLKSAEIRKSLGLTPLDRSSKIFENSVVNAPQRSPPRSGRRLLRCLRSRSLPPLVVLSSADSTSPWRVRSLRL